MKKFEKALKLNAKNALSKDHMKKIVGGTPVFPPCFRCCPDDPCSPVRHYCLDVVCPIYE